MRNVPCPIHSVVGPHNAVHVPHLIAARISRLPPRDLSLSIIWQDPDSAAQGLPAARPKHLGDIAAAVAHDVVSASHDMLR